MHTQDRIPHGNGFLGALTRQILLPPHRTAGPFHGGYGSIPRREGNWGCVRGEHQNSPKYMSDSLMLPDGDRSIIPPHFEHRMSKESIDEPNWRFPPDRSVTLNEMSDRGRSVYRQNLPGLKTADLSHRLRHSPRANKKPIFINQSSPRPFPHPSQRTDKKLSAKDRLTLPTQGEKRTEPRIIKKGMNISKYKNRTVVPEKSSTQNDPRIRNDSYLKSDIPNEPRMASIDKYIDNVIDSLSPIKSPMEYFDEDSSLKKETQTGVHQTFDVPLPPLVSPKQNNQQTEITRDSFWDETEDCLPVTEHIPYTQNDRQGIFTPVNPHSIETRNEIILSEGPMECNQNVNFNYFDDEISSNSNQPQPTTSIATNKKHSNPHRNAIKQRRDEKSKRYSRKEISNEQKKLHSKRSHLNSNSHKPNHLRAPVSNSPIIKLNTQSHIRLKKTVNLADQESEHSSSEEETNSTPVSNNIYIPLPTSPLQPLRIETPNKLHSNDVSNDFSGQIDFASIKTQEMVCDTAAAVQGEGSHSINKPTDTKDIHEVLEQRPLTLSESSDIGLHIEYVSDDVISKSPVGFNVEISTEIPKLTQLPSLLIKDLKPTSPKCETATPDSVFTPGFSCSQLPKTFSIESIDSLVRCLDSSVVENESVNSEKHNSLKRKSNRKPRKSNPNNESDLSFNSTREVCIPITKLNVRHYGAKPRASHRDTSNGREANNSKLVPTCLFCQRAANHGNLGLLYGPYEKRGNSLSLNHANRIASKEFNKNELWVHASCALYSPGVHLLAFQLDGLVDAYDTSREVRCEECGERGATIPCQTNSCTRVYHYVCATSSCSLNDSMQLLCPSHTTDTPKDL